MRKEKSGTLRMLFKAVKDCLLIGMKIYWQVESGCVSVENLEE